MLKRRRLDLRCRFFLFDCALVTDIEASSAEDTFALIDLIGDSNVDAAFGAQQRAPSAGYTTVRNEIVLLILHRITSMFLCIIAYHERTFQLRIIEQGNFHPIREIIFAFGRV